MTTRGRYTLALKFGQLVAVLIVFVVCGGCRHSDRGKVSGKLLRADGTSLEGARIVARNPDTGKSAYGTTDDSGDFSLGGEHEGDGVTAGTYQLSIAEDLGDEEHRRRPSIAAKYNNGATSGLSVTVEGGRTSSLEFKLDSR